MPNLSRKSEAAPVAAGTKVTKRRATKSGIPWKGCQGKSTVFWEYTHNPHSWSFSESRGFYPRLNKVFHRPGLNGYTEDNPGGAYAELHRFGAILIDSEDQRLGQFKDYIREYPTSNGRKIFVSMFEQFRMVGSRVKWSADERLYCEFLQLLVDKGLIEPMDEMIRDELIERQQETVKRTRRDYSNHLGSELHLSRMKEQERRLALMEGRDPDAAEKEALVIAESLNYAADQKTRVDTLKEQIAEAEPAPVKRKPGRPKKGTK